MSKVSIVIPVYNLGNLLHRCLGSVLAQTYTDFQLILIDDGSSDNSLSICHQYAKDDSRIEVFHHENHGVSYTRNVGISQATGDYIIFIDGDDAISNTYIADLVSDAENSGADIVLCGILRIHENQEVETMSLHRAYLSKKLFWEFCCTSRSPLIGYVPNKLYRLELIKRNNLRFNPSMHAQEDLDFALRAYSRARRIITSNVCGYSYFYTSGKRKMPVEDLIKNQISLYENSRLEHVSSHALKEIVENVHKIIFGYISSLPSIQHIEKVRLIPKLDNILHQKSKYVNLRQSVVVYLFSKCYFRSALAYIRFEKIIKKLVHRY